MTTINLYGPINSLGFGIHFSNWAAQFCWRLGSENVAIIPTGPIDFPQKDPLHGEFLCLMSLLKESWKTFDPKGLSINLWSLPQVEKFTGSKRLFYTVFEGSALSAPMKEATKKVDGIIVPTHWHRQVLLNQGVTNCIGVIPEGVDSSIFHYGETGLKSNFESAGLLQETVTFVSVGKLEKRKGMEVLLDALTMLRQGDFPPVRVLAHWRNPFLQVQGKDGNIDWFRIACGMLQQRGFRPTGQESFLGNSEFMRWFLPPSSTSSAPIHVDLLHRFGGQHSELVRLYRAGDFGIFPYFAEGWGLPLQESMACGLPPICQFYSGPTEYLVPGSFIPLEGVEAFAQDKAFFHGDQGTWSQVKTSSLFQAITTALTMPLDKRREMGTMASAAALKFTWERSARETIALLESNGYLEKA